MKLQSVAISVIVPIFNAERFLKATIESVLSQSFLNFELMLINDGSTDKSKSICEEFATIDNRVRLINKINGGVSSARNVGIKNASGKYILHVDADDILQPGALSNLYECAIFTHADIIVANYVVKYSTNEKVVKQKAFHSAEEFLFQMLIGEQHAGLWNKLIIKDCYKDLSFDEEVNYMEDKLILTQMLFNNPSISFLDFEVYIYIQRDSSITNKISATTILSMEKAISTIDNLLKDKRIFSRCLDKLKLDFKIKLLNNSDNRMQLINKFNEVNDKVLYADIIPVYYRVLLWLELHNISILTKIFYLLK